MEASQCSFPRARSLRRYQRNCWTCRHDRVERKNVYILSNPWDIRCENRSDEHLIDYWFEPRVSQGIWDFSQHILVNTIVVVEIHYAVVVEISLRPQSGPISGGITVDGPVIVQVHLTI